MSYILRLTNGQVLLTLADQQTDSVSTSLTLIGKNVNSYGTALNDNFIRLMENFANNVAPTNPLYGQLWFNSFEQRLYFYNNSLQFKPVGSPIVTSTPPNNLVTGDLWIDSAKQQLNFYNGTTSVLVGPTYDARLGNTGILSENVFDFNSINRTVGTIYVNNSIIGLISSSTFNLRSDYSSIFDVVTIQPGIVLSPGHKLYGTATNAESVGNINASDIVLKSPTVEQVFNGPIGILSTSGVTIGQNSDISINVLGTSSVATISVNNLQDFNFTVFNSTNTSISCLYYSTSTNSLGIFNNTPIYPIDVSGNVNIRGNLSVSGTSTFITVINLQVNNKTIDLASSSTSDITANGGGIVLHGSSLKSFLWNSSNQSWTSTENINLSSGTTYKINGQDVITSSSLGTVITSAPGLTNLPSLTTASIGQVVITSNTIGVSVSSPLIIGSNSTTAVDFNGKKIQNIYTPGISDSSNLAASKGYVDSAVATARSGQFVFSLDVTGYASGTEDPALDTFVINMLGILAPPTDPSPYGVSNNGRARVMVTRYQTSSTTVLSNPIGLNPVNVFQAGTSDPVTVVQYQTNYVASSQVPVSMPVVNRAVKQYIVSSSTWIRYIYTGTSNTVYSDGTW